jgi:predicted O-methyltransferase YrrM
MSDPRDKSYLDKIGKVTSAKRDEDITMRRGQARQFLSLLPSSLLSLPDSQLELLDSKIKDTILQIEQLSKSWSYTLKSDELLGQEFDETSASLWQCSRATGVFLNMIVRLQKPKHILELGTSVGYSTLWMADVCKKVGGHITTIEYLKEKVKLARANFAACQVESVIDLVEGDISKVLAQWTKEAPDLVFMDPNKEWQNHYLGFLKEIMAPGSVIVTDNAFDSHDIAEEYVQNLSTDFSSLFIALDEAGTILSVKS